MRKRYYALIILLILCLLLPMDALAHKGRTDGNGGHKDSKNQSGLGGYHYHHGMGPHLHPNGICPYDSDKKQETPKQESPKAETPKNPPTASSVNGELLIVYLDVGQADSVIILLPNGEFMLIDAGETNSNSYIIDFLKGMGEAFKSTGKITLDYVIATHPHFDHISSMTQVLKTFDVKNVYMPDVTHTSKAFANLIDVIDKKGLDINIAQAGKVLFDYGNLRAEFLAPVGSGYSDLNDFSAVLMLTYNDRRFLFMGDAGKISENEILAAGYNISADVIKIGHHGGDEGSTRAFIQKVAPKYAVISCGFLNEYGHPSENVLATLKGINVFRTDRVGDVLVVYNGAGDMSVTASITNFE